MNKFPIFFDLSELLVVVVGGGTIATRRVQSLVSCGANVRVISPSLTDELDELFRNKKIQVRKREYKWVDLSYGFLVLACTDNAKVNHQITVECRKMRTLCNNASDQDECDFFFPAVVQTPAHVIGIVGDGSDHKSTRVLATDIRARYGKKEQKIERSI